MARTKETGSPRAGVHRTADAASLPPKRGKGGSAAKNRGSTSAANDGAAPPPHTQLEQPREMTDAERAEMRAWLDRRGAYAFQVACEPRSRKRKRGGPDVQEQDLFDSRLRVAFEVRPADRWQRLKRYKKFTVGSSESIALGTCVFVKHDDHDGVDMDIEAQWKAVVHEVRALDQEHVYARVSWLNRPEDLDSGRKAYHGRYELVPTNHMDVIDAGAVNGGFVMQQWNDGDDDKPAPPHGEFFWRQTYDTVNTGTFSKLRPICVDRIPQNPDRVIVQCPNPDCKQWLHAECIASAALARIAGKKNSKAELVETEEPSLSQATVKLGALTATVYIEGQARDKEDGTARTSEIVVTDADGGPKMKEEVRCLFCKTKID